MRRLLSYFNIAVVLLGIVVPSVRAETPKKPTVNGKLTRIDGVPVLYVWGTPQERGYAHGYLLARKIIDLLDTYLSDENAIGGPEMYEAAIKLSAVTMSIGVKYRQELQGMFAGIEARLGDKTTVKALGRKLELRDLVGTNCVADSSRFGCSSFAAWGPMTQNGHTIAGRNFDWYIFDALVDSQMIVVQLPEPGNKALGWVSVTWPGSIGCFTGMNAEGVCVSLHDAAGGRPTKAIGFTPRVLALRDAIEAARAETAIQDITNIFRDKTVVIGNNVPVVTDYQSKRAHRTAKGPFTVFEYDGNLDNEEGVTVRTVRSTYDQRRRDLAVQGGGFFEICTNHYRKRSAPSECDRYATMDMKLKELAESKKGLETSGAWKILRSVGRPSEDVPGLLTYHSVVFEPHVRKMHVAFCNNGKAAPAHKPMELDVNKLLQFDRTTVRSSNK